MDTIDYMTLAEEWVSHLVSQYGVTHVCRRDVHRIGSLLKDGYTVLAFRDPSKVLRVVCLGQSHSHVQRLLLRFPG